MAECKLIRSTLMGTAALLGLLAIGKASSFPSQGQTQDEEQQMGQEVFYELRAKCEIIEFHLLYTTT